jgi:membrane-bound lytic murein transglycosylase B
MWVRRGSLGVIAAVLLAFSSADAAHAQFTSGTGLAFLDNLFTGTLSKASPPMGQPGGSTQMQSPPAATNAPLPWSGEDGASGHPLMTASAIREAAANFDNCVASMWPDAARRNISQASFQRFTAGLTPDLRIMDLMDSQP